MDNFYYEKKCKVKEPLGLCGRPSSAIARIAQKISKEINEKLDIKIKNIGVNPEDYRESSPGSPIQLMMLEAKFDTELIVSTKKEHLVKIVNKIADFIDNFTIKKDMEQYRRQMRLDNNQEKTITSLLRRRK